MTFLYLLVATFYVLELIHVSIRWKYSSKINKLTLVVEKKRNQITPGDSKSHASGKKLNKVDSSEVEDVLQVANDAASVEIVKKQKVLQQTQEIDVEETLNGLEYNKSLFFFTLSDVEMNKLESSLKGVPKILRVTTSLFTLRIFVFNILIPASQSFARLSVSVMIIMEIFFVCVYIT